MKEHYSTSLMSSFQIRHHKAVAGIIKLARGRREDFLVSEIAAIVHGLFVREWEAERLGWDAARIERDLRARSAGELLDRILERDGRPLEHARPLDRRVAAHSRHYAVLAAALLRAIGKPSRVRCGFSAREAPEACEDHWICEVQMQGGRDWSRIDATAPAEISGSPAFVSAADAWKRSRRALADLARLGIAEADYRRLWFVGAALMRDVAAINGVEVLPADVWGAVPTHRLHPSASDLDLLDHLAEVADDLDERLPELRRCFMQDERLRVPSHVYNAWSGAMEPHGAAA